MQSQRIIIDSYCRGNMPATPMHVSVSWLNLLPSQNHVLVVISPLCPGLYGIRRGVILYFLLLNEFAFLFTKKYKSFSLSGSYEGIEILFNK